MKYVAAITQIGLAFVVNVLVFIGIGLFLDSRLNLGGVGKITGVIVGLASGFYNSYQVLKRIASRL
ncbi:MAG TPA: AtpZ/AtpI family protein [Firmicutes bacterium]|nr:AtpZ/AtpI family protein [Bacillota bacterium]